MSGGAFILTYFFWHAKKTLGNVFLFVCFLAWVQQTSIFWAPGPYTNEKLAIMALLIKYVHIFYLIVSEN